MSKDLGDPKTTDSYDVTILGGGPAGSATALALRGLGAYRVLMVEAGRFESVRIGESIPPDTGHLLRALDIWDAFRAEGHEPCHGSCSSWGTDELGYNDFLFHPNGHGWHLDRRRFDAFLAHEAQTAGVEVRTSTRFVGSARDGDEYLLHLDGEAAGEADVRSRFVVDATGLGARFARRNGARRLFHDRLVCATAFFERTAASSASRLTFLEAVENGWWYAARLPGERVAVALASDSEFIKSSGADREDGWFAELQHTQHLAAELAGSRLIEGSLDIHIASSSRLDRFVGDRWLAVGDAATTYDPISSQGVYKALAGGLRAAPVVAAQLSGSGGPESLAGYQDQVTRDFKSYLAMRDHFYGLELRWPASPFWLRRRQASP